MDTRKVAAEYRLSQWMHVIQEQKSSGLNITPTLAAKLAASQ